MSKVKKTIAKIWVGGLRNPAYEFFVKESRTSIDGTSVLLIADDGTEFEVSPHNLVMITYYENEGEDNEQICYDII